MTLEEDLRARLTAAIKSKNLRDANILRMIQTKIMERRTAASFQGVVDDELVRDVIGAYKKSLEKARDEYGAAGDRGAAAIAELDHEIQFCQQFLPALMGEDQARAAVQEAIAELGAGDVKMAGRVVGAVMKKHRGRVDAGLVKRLAEAVLGAARS
jgi:hypothetical protein